MNTPTPDVVLKKHTNSFDKQFHRACQTLNVVPYLHAEAAEDFYAYDLVGSKEAVAEIIHRFGIVSPLEGR